MKRLISLIWVGLGAATAVQADIIYVQGDVSGTWSADTVMVTGEVRVPPNASLVIEPGTQVLFQGYYKFIVDRNAILTAIGTPNDWIRFDGISFTTEWHGFHFVGASSNSRLEYCLIRQGRASGISPNWQGGGVYLYQSSITIANCRIESCTADMEGGGIFCQLCNPVIVNNVFVGNHAIDNGGAIFVGGAAPLIAGNIFIQNGVSWHYGGAVSCWGTFAFSIHDNIFVGNTALAPGGGGSGGAIGCVGGDVQIYHNIFAENEACWLGGGIFTEASGAGIHDNVFLDNYASDGGAIGAAFLDDLTLTHNLFCGNSAEYGGGIWGGECIHIALDGNTIANNQATSVGGGFFAAYWNDLIHNVFWQNSPEQIYGTPQSHVTANYCDVQGGWAGIGNLNVNPQFVQSNLGDYRLLWGSPCIDTGDPNPIYNDPDGTRADMGAFYYDQSTLVRILLTPHEIPYLIPEIGGSMDYTIRAFNRDSLAHAMTVWCDVTLPDSTVYGPVLGPVVVTLGAGALLERVRAQNVPAVAPMGVYHYNAYAVVGQDTSKDSFMWGKLGAAGRWSLAAGGWSNTGEPVTDVVGARRAAPSDGEGEARLAPTEFALHPCSPNPFNAETSISFELRAASFVNLRVYDTAGRLVATLIDGWRTAGTHELTWDAGKLPSGIYFARLEAGEYVGVEKMVLLK